MTKTQPARPVLPAFIRERGIKVLGIIHCPPRTDAERAAFAQYKAECARWNAWVEQERATAKRAAEVRQAKAATAATHAAACKSCFTIHAGDCY